MARFTEITLDAPNRALDAPWPTVTIVKSKLEDARAILNKIADRAASYGQEITWHEDHYVATMYRELWSGKREKIKVPHVDLFVTGGAPKIGDHEFVAMLERTAAGTLVKAVPDKEVGAFGRDWDGSCAHCDSKRARVHGYVIESKGDRMIVGKSCVRDYLGMDFPQNMLSVLNQVVDLSSMGDENDEGYGVGGGAWATDVLGVAAAARCAVNRFGYAKKNADQSTYDRVSRLVGPAQYDRTDEQRNLRAEFNENAALYVEEAQKMIDWAVALEANSDYLHNLKVIFSSGYVSQKNLGLAVSIVIAYDSAMERAARAAAPKVESTGHFGEIKKRTEHTVTLDRIFAQDNQWGSYKRFFFRTPEGQTLIWTTDYLTDLMVDGKAAGTGSTFKMAFTPTKHSEYQGVPQTYVNRCKVVEA